MAIYLTLLLSAPIAYAQSPTYQIDHWTADNGLPQNYVISIAQTRDGYIWLVTYDGLARFDGVRFVIFNKGNTRGINSNRFVSLLEDKQGTLWAETEDSGITAYRDGVFRTYTTADGLLSNHFFVTGLDQHGDYFQLVGGQFVYWRGNRFVKGEPLFDERTSRTIWGRSGKQWKISLSGITESKDGQEINYPIPLTRERLWDVATLEDRHGHMWLGNPVTRQIYYLNDGQITRFSEKDGLPKGMEFYPAGEDDEGGIWFNTNLAKTDLTRTLSVGIVRFKDGRFTFIGREQGLPEAIYNLLITDREGLTWLPTSKGLYRLKRKFITAYSKENGLFQNDIYPLIQTRNGDIYIGSGPSVMRYRGGTFETKVLLEKGAVQSLWEDRAGRIWIGLSGRLFIWDGKTLKHLKPETFGSFGAYAIQEDSTGAIWVGGDHGLLKFQGEQLIASYTTKDGLPSNNVKVIHEIAHGPHKGELWIGTYGGLAQFKDGRFISFTSAQGLTGNSVRSIYEDAEGTLWVGTYDDGLSRFRDGRFVNYRMEHGLYSNGVFHILEDKHGYFWISCNQGIYRVSRQELNRFAEGRIPGITSIVYGKQDGMLNSECNGGRQAAGLIAQDGKFWFPTMGGVAVVDPEAVKPNSQPPPVFIESVEIERRNVDFQNGVTVQADQHDVEINYTGLSFIKSELVKFKYKLEGIDADWVDAGTRRVAYFPYLPAGNYTFRVIAANSDGVWNTTGASVRVSVLAPFWRSWWFASLCMAGIVGIVIGVMMVRQRRRIETLKQQRASQMQFSRQLIESQERERNRIAAELHDGLGQRLLVIKNWAELSLRLTPENVPNREQLHDISENASLALEETRRVVLDLRPHQLDKIGLANSLRFTVEQIAESSGIDIKADIAELDGAFGPDQEVSFYRIVQECLNNIVKHSGATQASVVIERGASIRLRVSDNGRGVAPNTLNNKQSGFGLSGIKERTRMLGGKYHMDSGPGKGTTIEILISDAPQGKGNNESRNQHRDG